MPISAEQINKLQALQKAVNQLNKLAKKRNMSWDNLWSDLPV